MARAAARGARRKKALRAFEPAGQCNLCRIMRVRWALLLQPERRLHYKVFIPSAQYTLSSIARNIR